MEIRQMSTLSRRVIIIRAAGLLAVAAAPGLAGRAQAQAKLAKDAVKYQTKAKDGKDCDDCLQFVPGKSEKAMGTCKIVEGPISPNGWCIAFAQKPEKHG
jgi:hypothetical protein